MFAPLAKAKGKQQHSSSFREDQTYSEEGYSGHQVFIVEEALAGTTEKSNIG
jgi:hypothetical protein